MTPLRRATFHPKRNGAEEVVQPHRCAKPRHEKRPRHVPSPLARGPVNAKPKRQNGKVQRWVVVVHVGDARHGEEGQVVQEPAEHGVQARVVEVVDFGGREICVAALPAHDVKGQGEEEEDERREAGPVDERVAEEEVFND